MTNSWSIGHELRRKCHGTHPHQPLVDGRAKDVARYPPALRRAICRGIAKEKMRRQFGIRAAVEVGEGVHKRKIDTEEFHENDSIEVERFIEKQLAEAEGQMNQADPTAYPLRTAPGRNREVEGSRMGRLGRLTHHKNKAGYITTSLAYDDLAGMKLDAGKVVEACTKEVIYLRGKRVYGKIPRHQALRNKWNIIKTKWIDINNGDDASPVYRSRVVGT